MEKKRIYWIDGLKLFACMCVFYSHFQGFFMGLCENDMGYGTTFQTILESPFNIFKNGNLWMCMFCVISGYFASKKNVDSFRKLLSAICKRYLRFVIPFFVVNLLTYVLYYTVGIPTAKYGDLFGNSWFGEFYDFKITLWIVLRASLKLTSELNSPLWMILPLFVGTCFIYLCKYLLEKMPAGIVNSFVVAVAVVVIVYFPGIHDAYLYTFITCMGAFLGVIIEKNLWKNTSMLVNSLILLFIYFMLGYAQDKIISCIPVQLPQCTVNYLNAVYSIVLLTVISQLQGVQRFFSKPFFKKNGKLSFGIYVLHWLALSIFSLYFYGLLEGKISTAVLFLVNFIVTSVVVAIGAKIFNECVEQRLMKVPDQLMERLIKRLKISI